MKKPNPESKRISDVDGFAYTQKAEEDLNELAAVVFREDTAQRLLAYLKSITINYVNGPRISSDELRHIEGQRYIVGIIERRIERGRQRK